MELEDGTEQISPKPVRGFLFPHRPWNRTVSRENSRRNDDGGAPSAVPRLELHICSCPISSDLQRVLSGFFLLPFLKEKRNSAVFSAGIYNSCSFNSSPPPGWEKELNPEPALAQSDLPNTSCLFPHGIPLHLPACQDPGLLWSPPTESPVILINYNIK